MRWSFIVAAALILSCNHIPPPEQKSSPIIALVVITGTVTEVGHVWTMNGDGSIVVTTSSGRKVTVGIRGWPANYPRTKIELKTVKYIQDLIGHTVQIRGVLRDNCVSADILTEM